MLLHYNLLGQTKHNWIKWMTCFLRRKRREHRKVQFSHHSTPAERKITVTVIQWKKVAIIINSAVMDKRKIHSFIFIQGFHGFLSSARAPYVYWQGQTWQKWNRGNKKKLITKKAKLRANSTKRRELYNVVPCALIHHLLTTHFYSL